MNWWLFAIAKGEGSHREIGFPYLPQIRSVQGWLKQVICVRDLCRIPCLNTKTSEGEKSTANPFLRTILSRRRRASITWRSSRSGRDVRSICLQIRSSTAWQTAIGFDSVLWFERGSTAEMLSWGRTILSRSRNLRPAIWETRNFISSVIQ
jgi:hypothetical protein